MRYHEWCVLHNRQPTSEGADAWNNALKVAQHNIKEYGDQYRKSSLKVGMAVDACERICERMRDE